MDAASSDGDRMWTAEGTFARRVRMLILAHGWSLAMLAEKTSLDPSLVSRLLSEREETRRQPQMEHILALARVLEVSPADLVVGTEAAHVLGEWVPRAELEAEVQRRLEAQRGVLTRERDLAALGSEAIALRSELNMLRHGLREALERAARAEAELRMARSEYQVAVARIRSEREIADQQRVDAVALFVEAEKELHGLRSRLGAAQRSLEAEQRTRGQGFFAGTLLGGVIGAVLASRTEAQRDAIMSTPAAWAVGLPVADRPVSVPEERTSSDPSLALVVAASSTGVPTSVPTEGSEVPVPETQASERPVAEPAPKGPARTAATRGKAKTARVTAGKKGRMTR